MRNYKKEWFGNIRFDLLAGLVVCMALIPEVIGFTIVAGVDPMIGVYSSFCISVITAIFGGRTAMISAAAGSIARKKNSNPKKVKRSSEIWVSPATTKASDTAYSAMLTPRNPKQHRGKATISIIYNR